MRQSGILGAAVLYALDHQYDRLADDHANAKALASLVAGAGGASVVAPDTNIVMVDLPSGRAAAPVVAACRARGVLVAEWSDTRIRMVTHLDASAEDIARAGAVVRAALESPAAI
jgi:threonine aldolase